jgi:mono/diheme cytochrome c family protein
MLWKTSAAAWVVASYRWNEAQTDAALVGDDGEPDVAEVAANRRHSIPSTADCRACHGAARLEPLGFNPLQLSTDRDPGALHAEALSSADVTLKTLVDAGLLSPARRDLVDAPPRIATGSARTRAMLGYLSSNCGSCHRGDGEIAVSVPSLRYADVMRDGDAVAAALVGRPTAWSIPGSSGPSVLVAPGAPDRSALHARMRSRSPSSQMPPLGTVLRDQAAVEELARWISTELGARR